MQDSAVDKHHTLKTQHGWRRDSMVAGPVLCLTHGKWQEEILRFGIACGTVATLNDGTELCRKTDVERLLPLVKTVYSSLP